MKIFYFLLSIILIISSCSKSAEPEKKKTIPLNNTLLVEAAEKINQYNQFPNPVVVRLYQLANKTAFDEASFWEIFDDKSENMAGEVIDSKSLAPLYPAESRLVPIDLKKGTLYLGVFGEFADYENYKFRDVVPISPTVLDSGVTISITTSAVEISRHQNKSDTKSEENTKNNKTGLLRQIIDKIFGGLFSK